MQCNNANMQTKVCAADAQRTNMPWEIITARRMQDVRQTQCKEAMQQQPAQMQKQDACAEQLKCAQRQKQQQTAAATAYAHMVAHACMHAYTLLLLVIVIVVPYTARGEQPRAAPWPSSDYRPYGMWAGMSWVQGN